MLNRGYASSAGFVFYCLAVFVVVSGCGNSGGTSTSTTGGAQSSGGETGFGGGAETGGSPSAGGSRPAGGATGTGGNGVGGNGAGGGLSCWRPFNDQSPWNSPIAASAVVDPNSATLISDFSTIAGQTEFWINIEDYSVPIYWVDSTTTAMVTVQADFGGTGFRTGATSDSIVPGTGPAPIPVGATAAAGTDRHLAIVDRVLAKEWGFWDAAPGASGWTAGLAATLDLSGTGVRPPERNTPWWAGHGPRACGFGLINGLITADDLRCGAIEHALVVAYSHIKSRYYTAPASSAQGTTSEALSTRGIPCGGQIQLDPALDITTLGLTPAGIMIARALQKYGAFVGDYSGATSLYGEASAAAQAYFNGGVLDNGSAQPIPLKKFRVLQIGTTYDNGN